MLGVSRHLIESRLAPYAIIIAFASSFEIIANVEDELQPG
jgi:hypothetical protein